MNINQAGIELIKKFEGLRTKAYLCPSGIPTIGYGHTRNVNLGDRCTEEQAEEWLKQDLKEAEKAVMELVKVSLNENQFSALVSFVFNVGIIAFSASTLLKKLNNGNHHLVPAQLMRWTKGTVNGTKMDLPGLVKRRTSEAKLWEKA